MAIMTYTKTCGACGQPENPAIALHAQADCLASHEVHVDFSMIELRYLLAHCWLDDGTYSAVASDRPITEADALMWLARVHANDVERRPRQEGMAVTFDRWED